jgi:hypothetical protein
MRQSNGKHENWKKLYEVQGYWNIHMATPIFFQFTFLVKKQKEIRSAVWAMSKSKSFANIYLPFFSPAL